MHKHRQQSLRRIAMVAASLVATLALADPPGRVGRISFLSGTVALHADAETGWQSASLNYPVTSENSLWTERSSRAEVRVGSTSVRIDQASVLDLQRLNDTETIAYLQRGVANIRVAHMERSDQYLVLTPFAQVSLRSKGNYRIEVDLERTDTRISVFSGSAGIQSEGARLTIEPGKTAVVQVSAGRAALSFEHIAQTDFDDWALMRDERWDSRAVADVSTQMTGYEELGEYGSWIEESEYGRVWVPRSIADDWAPYRYGRWIYVKPWGWTWMDDAPWGFAPFHYGRWVHLRGRWAWWPGNRTYQPIYSPALIAWVGRPGWNVSFSTGMGPGIGWLPLAPWEAYVPWYNHNPRYLYNINHIYGNRPVVVKPPHRYANHKPGATVVTPTTFHSSAPVAGNRSRVSGETIWAQPVTQERAQIPQREASGARTAGLPNPIRKPAGVRATPLPEAATEPTFRSHTRTEISTRPAPSLSKPSAVAPPLSASMPSAPLPEASAHAARPKPNYVVPAAPSRPAPRIVPSQGVGEAARVSGETAVPRPHGKPVVREPVANIRTVPSLPEKPASVPAVVEKPRAAHGPRQAESPAERVKDNKGPKTAEN